ncbi:MAG: hypothetical protein Q9178_007301 [Gyalolechia marmorata]
MAEFAAAASAAGLASLGIQCCKGLTTYYNSYKAYDEQIGAILEQIRVLAALFEKLERVLSRNAANSSQASSLQQVDGILHMCRGRLQTLQSFLEKCQSVALPNSIAVLLQKIKARALFPFKEKTLLTLRENVQSLRDDIQFALSVLQIDLEMEQNQSIASLAAVSRNVEVASQTTHSAMQAMATPVHRMDTGFNLLLQQGENTTTSLSEMQVQAHHYHEAALDLYRHIPEQCRQLLQRDQTPSYSVEQDLITALGQFGTERELLRNAIRSLNQKREGEAQDLVMRIDVLNENIMKLQLGAISRPSLLPSADRENGQLGYVSQMAEYNVDAGQGLSCDLPRRRMKCNCDARYTDVSHGKALSTWRFGRLFGHEWVYRSGLSSTNLHRRTCPMSSTSPAVVTAQLSIRICGALLRGAAEATFSITRGADSGSENGQILTSGKTQAEISHRSLRREAPPLPSILPDMHTMYHCPHLTVKIANVLWEAGFREVDLLDQDDRTPLVMLGYRSPLDLHYNMREITEFAFWLYQKGALLYRPCRVTLQPDSEDVGDTPSRSERRVIHFLAAAFKLPFDCPPIERVQNEDTDIDDLSLESRQILQKVLQDDSSDNCLCACSRHGCMPATQFLKQIHSYRRSWSQAKKPFSTWLLRWLFENVPSKNFPVPVSREIIRLKTFEKLGLRHTCCSYEGGVFAYSAWGVFKTIEPAEAEEIRDEDRGGIQLLESLLPEFEEKLGDEDIKSFIDGYWTTRMKEVLAARDEEPLDWAGMKAAGVIFCDDDGSDDDGSDNYGSDE